MNTSFTIYRIYYGDTVVYVGRTKQPLQNRIRGHLFAKPMHRTIDIQQVSKIEYAELPTEADMYLYEIYYILKLRPALNVDDKAKDDLTVALPELEWREYKPKLFDKWKAEQTARDSEYERARIELRIATERKSVIRKQRHNGEMSEAQYYDELARIQSEIARLSEMVFG